MRHKIGLAAILLCACVKTPDPCTPAAASVIDEACVQAMAKALESCPKETKVDECPAAHSVAQACSVVVAAQETGCDK